MSKKVKAKAVSKAKEAKEQTAGPNKKERRPPAKKGKTGWEDDLTSQLSAIGLRVKKITADGNCFFRALSDQLQGDESQHSHLRQQVVQFMCDREDEFAPFVEDDQGFAAYSARMRREGVWAGHMELQAASLLLQANICIHQSGQPVWAIKNHLEGCRMLHMSYHDGEHYNSVRMADDYGPGAPQPVVVGAGGTAGSQQERCWGDAEEQLVMRNTGCDSLALVRKVLGQVGGSIDQAVERVIDILAAEEVPEAAAQEVPEAAAEGQVPAKQQVTEQQAVGREQQDPGRQDLLGAGQSPCDGTAAAAGGAPAVAAAVEQEEEEDEDGAAEACSIAKADRRGDPSVGSASYTAPGAAPGKSADRKRMHIKAGASVKVKSKAGADAAPSRNKACPCGSSQKYKNCCGAAAAANARRKQAAGLNDKAVASAELQLKTLLI